MTTLNDKFSRPLRSLRVSVTDRCNLRCEYCMPCEEYVWLERDELLTLEEIATLAGIFAELGVTKARLTGGEPLLRRNLEHLVEMLAQNPALTDMALTTNGVLLAENAERLRAAGLGRLTISLDTLRPERFQALTRRDLHARVLAGIAAATAAGFRGIKLNTVMMRGFNDDELIELLEFSRTNQLEIRFIEYMDVGGALRWSRGQVVTRREMLAAIARHYGATEPMGEQDSRPNAPKAGALGTRDSAPAERFRLPDGTFFGIISSTSDPFCGTCDRARITADGVFFLCLYAERGIDLKSLLRAGAPREEIAARIASAWQQRADRGAEQRLAVAGRSALFQIQELRDDPHREMHTRGG